MIIACSLQRHLKSCPLALRCIILYMCSLVLIFVWLKGPSRLFCSRRVEPVKARGTKTRVKWGKTLIAAFLHVICLVTNEPPHDKTNNVVVRPAKTQISLGILPVWSESSLSAWRNLGSLATHCAHSEDSDQTGRMPRLTWVFAGRTVILLVLSCGGSNV